MLSDADTDGLLGSIVARRQYPAPRASGGRIAAHAGYGARSERRRRRIGVAPAGLRAALAALLIGSVVFAARAQKTPDSITPTFVAHASMADLFEIEAGKIAVDKAKSADVRSYAQRMKDEHGKIAVDLKAAVNASDPGIPTTTKLDQPHEQMLDELRKAEGEAFDRLYLSFQAKGHAQEVALYQAYAQSGDRPEIKALVRDALPALKAHLDDARKLADAAKP